MAGREGAARPQGTGPQAAAKEPVAQRGRCAAQAPARVLCTPCAAACSTVRSTGARCGARRAAGGPTLAATTGTRGGALFQRHARACPACPLALRSTVLPTWLGVWTHRQCLVHVKAAGGKVAEEHRVCCPVGEVLRQPLPCEPALELRQAALLLHVAQVAGLRHGRPCAAQVRDRGVKKQAKRRFFVTEAAGSQATGLVSRGWHGATHSRRVYGSREGRFPVPRHVTCGLLPPLRQARVPVTALSDADARAMT